MGSDATAIQESSESMARPTESEIAIVAYQLWLERGCPVGSDQEDWFRAEAMLKNALVAKREDLFETVHQSPAAILSTESDILVEFASKGCQGHWEVWEREWGGTRWVWDVRDSGVGVSNRARSSRAAA